MIKRIKGFTIIELIVVIAIIAILAAVVMVNVTGYIAKSKESAILADFKQLPIIAAGYLEEHGSYIDLYQDSRILDIEKKINNLNNNYSVSFIDESGLVAYDGIDEVVRPMPYDNYAGQWVFNVQLNSTWETTYCIDYTGYLGTKGVSQNDELACLH